MATNGANSNASLALQSILECSIEDFLENVWQKECNLYRRRRSGKNRHTSSSCRSNANPLDSLVDNAWECVVALLQKARERFDDDDAADDMLPIVFQSGTSISPQEKYQHNLFHAYLDGCSVVVNHADLSSGKIAALCEDLQKIFPHTYANTYLTPPDSQAVSAHADDRDVFVIQLLGKKHWKVYQNVPIQYPYSHEQVGKNGLSVSSEILDGPVLMDTTLSPGDVLYMPRGYVHEATSPQDDFSFHVTIAIPTHDWTLAVAVTAATQQVLMNDGIENRMAMPLSLLRNDRDAKNNDNEQQNHALLEQQLETALNQVRQQVTIDSILSQMQQKISIHNLRAMEQRRAVILEEQIPNSNSLLHSKTIGREAAMSVTMDTIVRASTEAEKRQVVVADASQPRGLHVRNDTADALLGVLQMLKSHSSMKCKVLDLLELLDGSDGDGKATSTTGKRRHREDSPDTVKICNFTLLSFAKCCVELGGMTIVRS